MSFRGDVRLPTVGWRVDNRGVGRIDARWLARLREEVETTCHACFPLSAGYKHDVQATRDPQRPFEVLIHRGDFEATVVIETEGPHEDEHRRAVRVFGKAGSRRVNAIERHIERVQNRARLVGVAGGIAAFASLCWQVIGEHEPVLLLGGLLLVVVGLVSVILGGSFGAWLGERASQHQLAETQRSAEAEPGLVYDRRRWQGLVRRLSGKRPALGATQDAPFRALANPTMALTG